MAGLVRLLSSLGMAAGSPAAQVRPALHPAASLQVANSLMILAGLTTLIVYGAGGLQETNDLKEMRIQAATFGGKSMSRLLCCDAHALNVLEHA